MHWILGIRARRIFRSTGFDGDKDGRAVKLEFGNTGLDVVQSSIPVCQSTHVRGPEAKGQRITYRCADSPVRRSRSLSLMEGYQRLHTSLIELTSGFRVQRQRQRGEASFLIDEAVGQGTYLVYDTKGVS